MTETLRIGLSTGYFLRQFVFASDQAFTMSQQNNAQTCYRNSFRSSSTLFLSRQKRLILVRNLRKAFLFDHQIIASFVSTLCLDSVCRAGMTP